MSFLELKKAYWGYGLGSILMEEAIEWAQSSGSIRRLQLTVQKRNLAAVHLYKKDGLYHRRPAGTWCLYRRRRVS